MVILKKLPTLKKGIAATRFISRLAARGRFAEKHALKCAKRAFLRLWLSPTSEVVHARVMAVPG